MRVTVIVNPKAGGGRGRKFARELQRHSPQPAIDVAIENTGRPTDGTHLARVAAQHSDVIGVVGGDGTVHEVINGLMPDPKPIIVVPVGSGNDFASLFACPLTTDEFFRVLADGYGARVDVLDLGSRYCANSCGLGFEGLVNRHSHAMRWLPSSLVYMGAVFRALASLTLPCFSITTSDGEHVEGERLLVSIGNGRRTGGAFYMMPDAYPDDGLIDVCVVEPMSRRRIVRLLPTSLRGSHVERAEVRMLRTRSLHVVSTPGFPMHVDGELVDPAPPDMRITVLERSLPVLFDRTRPNRLCQATTRLLGG